MAAKDRLSIYHQNRLYGECLRLAVGASDQIDITIMDALYADALGPPRQEGTDLLLLDASLPDMMAFRFVQALRTNNRAVRTIWLVPSASPELIENCLQAGADGCVFDDDSLPDVLEAIQNVRAGRNYCSPKVAHRLFTTRNGGIGQPPHWITCSRDFPLTRREVEVLRLIAYRNLSNKQIASELGISRYTVKNHLHNIIEKLSVEDRQMAVRHAVSKGLLNTDGGVDTRYG